jgi:hypothetical protein
VFRCLQDYHQGLYSQVITYKILKLFTFCIYYRTNLGWLRKSTSETGNEISTSLYIYICFTRNSLNLKFTSTARYTVLYDDLYIIT